jgi:hypothetical protein
MAKATIQTWGNTYEFDNGLRAPVPTEQVTWPATFGEDVMLINVSDFRRRRDVRRVAENFVEKCNELSG